ncbi:MAG: Xaa-Pro peptidase family protein [Planctomycetota bacterium]
MTTAAAPNLDQKLAAVLKGLSAPKDLPPPIGAEDRAKRRERLALILAERGADALFVEPGATLRYLCGLEWRPSERLFGVAVLRDGGFVVVAPAFERDVLERALPQDAVAICWDEHEYGYTRFASELDRMGIRTMLMDPQVRLLLAERIGSTFEGSTKSGADAVRELRQCKDANELAIMRAAQNLTKTAIARVAEHTEPGMTAAQVGQLMHAAQRHLGLTDTWDLTLVGPGAADPHGHTDDTVIGAGDLLLCDTGGQLHGYHSDCTRTWVVGGEPSDEIVKAWDTVYAAQEAALGALRVGEPCGGVDRAARKVIEDAGYGRGYAAFSHRLGHGIGIEIHEPPYCDGGSEAKLKPGMCFSNEPGIYLRGKFGLRIEDIVAVGESGPEVMGERQKGPGGPF